MPFKKVTLKEWKALGLPVETSTIHFGANFFQKITKDKKKEYRKKNNSKLKY